MFEGKKAIIFDLDGTLIDSIGIYNDIDRELVTIGGGIPRPSLSVDRDLLLANNTTGDIYYNYAKYLHDSYNLSISVDEVNNLRNELFKKYINHKISLKESAALFLKKLKDDGYTLVLATISSKWVVDIYMNENYKIKNECNLNEMFEHYILTKDDVKKKKPDPEVYLKALQMLENVANKDECIVVEDSLSGVKASVNAGIDVICMYDKYSDVDRDEIIKLATYNVDNYGQLIDCLTNVNNQKTLRR